ncbi:GPW/gp25 family protein [Microbacterium terricola]|uniref:Baseplate protein n=1 Tax=Microbacterium terricola TaxID=344163 RepID=A0ABM8E0S9_9MICO|nr:GPW/gp25 family protein [Microbacterium terricola]UYK40719.1 GPW/gp25 family protein [Microbacterium terricola]BDV31544.1 baseplate protein [Microbacterium terricola]
MSDTSLGIPVDARVLGRGWSSPVRIGDETALAAGEDKVRQSIRLILGTRRGERVMRPDFGAGLEDFLFEPISTTTAALIRHRVETALVRWEPRIDVQSVRVEVGDRRQGRLDVEIDYRVRSTNTFYNLVYPFFLHEGGAT